MDSDTSMSDLDESCDEKPIWQQETRREPLGAARDEEVKSETAECSISTDNERIHALEEEHELLSSSVFSLTSHLAQVEFRLRQIIKAPTEEKDNMLKALEEFTSKSIPQVRTQANNFGDGAESHTCGECLKLDDKMTKQRVKQLKFIDQLKDQLKELESLTGDDVSVDTFEKHKHAINNLTAELDESLKESCQQPLTADELRHQINCAVRQYANRQVSKEEIVSKLQAHIDDMQKFIKIMQNESLNENKNKSEYKQNKKSNNKKSENKTVDDLRTETVRLMHKVSALIQIFTVSQFGCSPRPHQPFDRKSTVIVTHWGNLRARLEMSIESVLNILSHTGQQNITGVESYDSDSEEIPVILNNVPLTTAVRKHLAINIRDLLQHGLHAPNEVSTLVPFIGCFPMRRTPSTKHIHIWELLQKYYTINNGDRFNSTPARKLSQSFNLDIVGGVAISNKQSLLSTIDSIVATHTPYKRSYDAHFKAFVCAALNAQKLVIWLNLLLKCKSLISLYYSSTSYVVNTGFQDALHSLDRLSPYKFDLPVDLAVKQFQNIKDVFM